MPDVGFLRRENERLQSILASTRLGLWDWDMRTGETVFDERWAEIVGYRLAELQPTSIHTWEQLANPDDLAGSAELIARHVRGELPYYDIHVRMRHREGHWVWVHDRGRIVEWDDEGRPLRMTGTHEDVTARVEAERALSASRRRLDAMFRDHDAVMLLIDAETGRIVDANRSATAFYGYPQETLVSLSITDINALPAEHVTRLWHDAERRRRSYFVFPHRLASGEVRMVDVHSSPIEDDGRILLFSIVRDVTQHLRMDLLGLLAGVFERFASASAAELDRAIESVLGQARELLDADRAFLLQLAADGQTLQTTHHRFAPGPTPPIDDPAGLPVTMVPWSLAELGAGRILALPTVASLPAEASREREILQRRGIRSLLVLPLGWRGRLEGLIGFACVRSERTWTDEEIEVMRLVSGVIAQSIDRQAVQQRLELADSVFRNSQEGILVLGPDRRVLEVNPAFTAITGYDRDEVIGHLSPSLASHRPDPTFPQGLWATVERGHVWRGSPWSTRKDGLPYRQALSVAPVADATGGPMAYVASFADITMLVQQKHHIDRLTRFDALTGLPNRGEFTEIVGGPWPILGSLAERGAIVLLSLDRFASVNDSYGRETGDRVLATVAARLASHLGQDAVLARFGGDEFAVLATEAAELEQAVELAEALQAAVSSPIELPGGTAMSPSCSAGIMRLRGPGLTGAEALRHADAALHLAKQSGPGSIRIATRDLAERSRTRLSLESRLRHAWDARELTVHFQPQVDVSTGKVVGGEALLRWIDADGRSISPAEFIPLAEECGLIGPIGMWVIEQACELGRRILDSGVTSPTLAVNVSAVQFRDPLLVDRIADTLARTDFSARLLDLELTESTMLEVGDVANSQLAGLAELGSRLSVDDFGTGYSSFAALKRLPLHQLKIDRSFIRDVEHDADDRAIAAGVIGLGHHLGLVVLAEGVETAEQLAFLRSQGCDLFQGFLASRAVPAEDFQRMAAGGPLVGPAPGPPASAGVT